MHVIVPIDFSPASVNAARFAVQLLHDQSNTTIVLYHAYEHPDQRNEVSYDLRELKKRLLDDYIAHIECVADKSIDVVEGLQKKIKDFEAALVVMGIDNKTKLEQVLVGSNAVRMIEKASCPVLVIPNDAAYKQIKNVALASDYKNVEESIPVDAVKKILNIMKPHLHIVHINADAYISVNEEYIAEKSKLEKMFAEYQPQFYFLTNFNFHRTIQQFIHNNRIDLVLTFPRKHSFIKLLIRGKNTNKLVYESAIPVLAAHE